ncbi:heme exporter protein CcmB [Oligoflexaceae bacterium]|nr:heme exporter protein CcmB [Oligoflexaceae bacterium]
MNFLSQSWQVLRLGLSNEVADKERLISPILFAIVFVLLLWFSFGELPQSMGTRIFVAQTFLAMFFALQIIFVRIYDPEMQDDAMALYSCVPLNSYSLFIGKWIQAVLTASFVAVCTALIGALMLADKELNLLNGSFFFVLFLVIIGLCGIGVLLAGLTAKAQAKQVLFPLLFFPLTTPVMIVGVQVCIFVLNGEKTLSELMGSWLGLLIVFDLLYCTFSALLFDEIMKPE